MEPDGAKEIYINLIHYPVHALGLGKRIGIWFQGCSRHCRGCIAPSTWEYAPPAHRRTLAETMTEIESLMTRRPDGVTISGGEPFDQPDALQLLLQGLRTLGCRDVMIYSGYSFRWIARRHPGLLGLAAAIVDGPFRSDQETKAPWKGSENQRLHILTQEKELRRSYLAYRASRDEQRMLQIVEKKGKVFIIGIPRSKDVEAIKHGPGQGMPRLRGEKSSQ